VIKFSDTKFSNTQERRLPLSTSPNCSFENMSKFFEYLSRVLGADVRKKQVKIDDFLYIEARYRSKTLGCCYEAGLDH